MTDLFAEAVVSRYVRADSHFVPRPWFAERLQAALDDPACRFLLFTGEPGAGKTAAMAWLADQQPLALPYFVRRDSRQPLSAGDPHSLLLTIGHQLAARRPHLFQPERLSIVVQQRIDRLGATGRVVGIKVEELALSPFYRTAIRVEQHVADAGGEVVAIEAGRAVLDDRSYPPESLQYLALLDPAGVLLAEEPGARIVLFIDGLDELRYRTQGPTLLDWLQSVPPLPDNVRVVLASRPDDDLLTVFRQRQAAWLHEHRVDEDPDAVRADLTRYAASHAAEPGVQQAAARSGMTVDEFAGHTVDRAAGNFQYLSALYRGLRDTGAGPSLDDLPADLTGLYRFFVDQIAAAARNDWVELPAPDLVSPAQRMPSWDAVVEPLLAILAAAYAPVSRTQLERFLPGPPLTAALGRLRQFLREQDGEVTLYHDTFRAFLPERVDVVAAHRRIVRSYRAGRATWSDVDWVGADEYGLTYLAQHLSRLSARDDNLLAELDALLCLPLMREKGRRYGALTAFAADVRVAIEAAARVPGPVAFGYELRSRWLLANLAAAARAVPRDLVAAAARAGAAALALNLAELIPDWGGRSLAYLAAGAELIRAGQRDAGRSALYSSLAIMETAGDYVPTALVRIADGFIRAADRDGLDRIAAFVDRLDAPGSEDRQALFAEIARGYGVLGAAAACAAWAGRLGPDDRAALATAARTLVRAGDDAAALRLAGSAAAVHAEIAEEMVLQGRVDEGVALASRLLETGSPEAAHHGVKALVRSGAALPDLVARLPTAAAQAAGWLAGLAVTDDAAAMARPALDAVRAASAGAPFPADIYISAAPVLGHAGDVAVVRDAFQEALRLYDDGYGSSGKVVAAYAEAFAEVGDLAGIDDTLRAAQYIEDNTHAAMAFTGVVRACVAAGHRIPEVRAATRRLHRHFVDPWQLDVEIAFSLAEADRPQEALRLLMDLLTEVQRPMAVDSAVAWRMAAAKALTGCGRRTEALQLCREALARGETLARSGDEDSAAGRAYYLSEFSGQMQVQAVAEGMEWARVVAMNAPVLPVLAAAGGQEALEQALDRLERLVNISWPQFDAFSVLLEPAMEALIIAGDVERADRLLGFHVQAGARGVALAARALTALAALLRRSGHQTFLAAKARELAGAWTLDDDARAAVAVLLDAAGLVGDADRIWASVPAGDAWTEAALALAGQAAERGDADRAGRLLADLDCNDGPALYLSEAVRLWRLIGDEQGGETVNDVLVLLDESVSSAVPTILSRLAEGDPHPDRLVQAAADLDDEYWRRRAVAAVARTATGIESLDRELYPPEVRVEILAAVAARSGDLAGWRSALRNDPGLDLDVLTRRLLDGAGLLAGLDEGETLARVADALSRLEDWWWPQRPAGKAS